MTTLHICLETVIPRFRGMIYIQIFRYGKDLISGEKWQLSILELQLSKK